MSHSRTEVRPMSRQPPGAGGGVDGGQRPGDGHRAGRDPGPRRRQPGNVQRRVQAGQVTEPGGEAQPPDRVLRRGVPLGHLLLGQPGQPRDLGQVRAVVHDRDDQLAGRRRLVRHVQPANRLRQRHQVPARLGDQQNRHRPGHHVGHPGQPRRAHRGRQRARLRPGLDQQRGVTRRPGRDHANGCTVTPAAASAARTARARPTAPAVSPWMHSDRAGTGTSCPLAALTT